MKFWLKVASVPVTDLMLWATRAEELGFSGVNVGEHALEPAAHAPIPTTSVYPYGGTPPWPPNMSRPEPWVAFAACAAVTTRLRFMTDVALPIHEPVSWARQIATASAISGGRMALGVGVGWLKEEFAATGHDFTRRGRLLDERLALMQRLWAGEPVTVDVGAGPQAMAMTQPYPPSPVPILVGGASPAAFRRAARHDGWLGAEVVLDALPAAVAALAEERHAVGRDGPFEIVVALKDDPLDRRIYDRAAELGATAANVYAWNFQGETPEARLAALAAFARRIGIA